MPSFDSNTSIGQLYAETVVCNNNPMGPGNNFAWGSVLFLYYIAIIVLSLVLWYKGNAITGISAENLDYLRWSLLFGIVGSIFVLLGYGLLTNCQANTFAFGTLFMVFGEFMLIVVLVLTSLLLSNKVLDGHVSYNIAVALALMTGLSALSLIVIPITKGRVSSFIG